LVEELHIEAGLENCVLLPLYDKHTGSNSMMNATEHAYQ
jgi:hypothetical protein